MLMKLLKQQIGMSLIQGMVAASILAGSSLVVTRLINNQKLAQKGQESRVDIEIIHQLVYSVLQDKDHCWTTMVMNSIAWAANSTYPLPNIHTKGGNIVAQIYDASSHTSRINTSYIDGKVAIKSMSLRTGATRADAAKLEVIYMRLDPAGGKSWQGLGAKEIKKTVDVKIQFNNLVAGNPAYGCYAVLDDPALGNSTLNANFCASLGTSPSGESLFTYRADYNQCVLKQLTCPSGQIFAGITSTGSRICTVLHDWVDMDRLVDLSSGADCAGKDNVRFALGGDNRVIITCDGAACTSNGTLVYTPAEEAMCCSPAGNTCYCRDQSPLPSNCTTGDCNYSCVLGVDQEIKKCGASFSEVECNTVGVGVTQCSTTGYPPPTCSCSGSASFCNPGNHNCCYGCWLSGSEYRCGNVN
jgi:hypothetical protein